MISVRTQPPELSSTQERLLARREELEARRTRLRADRRREGEALSADAPDRAIQMQNDAVVDSIDATVEEELRSISAALERVRQGIYDVCETCGGAIGARRLSAVPYATQCQRCAAQANS